MEAAVKYFQSPYWDAKAYWLDRRRFIAPNSVIPQPALLDTWQFYLPTYTPHMVCARHTGVSRPYWLYIELVFTVENHRTNPGRRRCFDWDWSARRQKHCLL